MSQVYKNTKPGGWVEFSDYASTYYSEDGSLSEDHALKQWNTVLLDCESLKLGIGLLSSENNDAFLLIFV